MKDYKTVKIKQRGPAVAMQDDRGTWQIVISAFVGDTGYCADVIIPFGKNYEAETKLIAKHMNEGKHAASSYVSDEDTL